MSATLTNLKPLNLKPVQKDTLDLPLDDDKIHLLLCATGSVATIKIPNMINALSKYQNLSIRLIFTSPATNFLRGQSSEQPSIHDIEALPNVGGIYFDEDEWRDPWVRGNKILHIELRRWGLDGWSDNLLLSVIRAWDTTGELDPIRDLPGLGRQRGEGREGVGMKKKILVAPSMNTAMWKQPITMQQVKVLDEDWGVKNGGWFEVLQPMEKELACGDIGGGAMRDWRDIVKVVESRLGLR
ncbi:flavo protein [Lindgomyces ingoldianus]|uniref:Flavo protein n=1 Tax=Lindgomyces ingoldianus TaxID=673940 RepID=A0ACB6QWZ8_9PLEO|nr:flavo protein [Lindgomyces ingoldianus]KAF2471543.1 flavo protein [Lindgomyces ingoldianus]